MNMAWNVNRMSSFSIRAIGYLARSPEVHVAAEGTYCRFCLTSEDSTEDDRLGRLTVVVQTIGFVATHLVGAAIADAARMGDQLVVEGKIRNHHWTAKGRHEDHTFVVTGFRFGTRKGGPDPAGAAIRGRTPISPAQPAEAAMAMEAECR
jgi:single-stranded DNA-binding protein